MLLDNHTKQSPIVGVAGLGGGINSYIFLSSGSDYVISRSLRFNSGDAAYLSRTPSATGNRRTWTWSNWIKRSNLGSEQFLLKSDVGGGNARDAIRFESGDTLRVFFNGTNGGDIVTTQVFRDPSAWYHLVLAVDTTQATSANRVKIYINGSQITDFSTETYPTQNYNTGTFVSGKDSTIANDQNSNYLNGYLADLHFVDGQALTPTSFGSTDDNGVWQPKKFSGSHGTNGFHLDFKDNSSNAALGYDAAGSNNWTVTNLNAAGGAATNGIAFDGNDKVTFPGMALGTGNLTFECFFKLDSGTSGFRRIMSRTEGGAGNDLIIRVHTNGYMQWYFDSQEHTGSTTVTTGVWHHSAIVRSGSDTISYYYDGTRIGTDTSNADMTLNAVILAWGNGSEYFTGQIYGARITKQALYTGASYTVPTSAITTTSQGASSSNVVHLSATTSTTTTNSGTTGNGTNDGDPSAVSGAYPFGGVENIDSLIDSPSQSVADETDTGVGGQITGNYATYNPVRPGSGTKSNGNLTVTGTGQVPDVASIAPNSGKWYAEIKWDSGSYARVGLQDVNIPTSDFGGVNGQSYRYESNSGNVQPGGQTYSTYAAGDIIGVAFDCDAGKLWLAKNGTWQNSGNPASGTGAVATNLVSESHYAPASSSGSGSSVFTLNAGQRAFAYTAPTGFKALCTSNLPEPTIADGSKYFDTKLYTGNGGTQSITMDNSALSPDFVWIKCRNDGFEHQLFDSVRGALKSLRSDNSSAEATVANSLTSFDSNGFSLGGSQPVNHTKNYAAWAWDAGSSNTTIAAGSLNSSVYNQSQTWSSLVSTPNTLRSGGGAFAYGALSTIFDGNLANGVGTDAGNLTLNFSSGISASNSTVEVYIYHTYSATITAGGNTYTTNTGASGTTEWVTVSGVSGTITQITVNGSGSVGTCGGIKIDGKILVDSGVTPSNVPSIASQVRASAESGFSIVSWTGTGANGSLGHGLNAEPELIIVKLRNNTVGHDWSVYSKSTGNTHLIKLNDTPAASSAATAWNNTTPTSSVFTVGSGDAVNENTKDVIAYCFAPVAGYSSFGKYTGNGDADGIFIYTGFTPSWLLFKRSDSSSDWSIYDTARDPHNVAGDKLEPNTTDTESAEGAVVDILSNGFKFRRNSLENGGNDVYIYAAFASHPFQSARAR